MAVSFFELLIIYVPIEQLNSAPFAVEYGIDDCEKAISLFCQSDSHFFLYYLIRK
jgi:hypothetical protein